MIGHDFLECPPHILENVIFVGHVQVIVKKITPYLVLQKSYGFSKVAVNVPIMLTSILSQVIPHLFPVWVVAVPHTMY